MINQFALLTASLMATIGFGAMLMGSDVPYAHTGSFVSSTNIRCLLAPELDCDAMLFDGAPTAAERSPQQAHALLQDGPALPVLSPYSGTFVTFALR